MCLKTYYPKFSPVLPFAVLLPVLWIGSSSVFSDEHSTSDKSGSSGQRQWGRWTMKEQWTDGHWWRGERWTGLNVCVLFYCYTHASCSTKQLLTPEPLFLHLHRPVLLFVRGIYFFYMRKNMQRQNRIGWLLWVYSNFILNYNVNGGVENMGLCETGH